MGNFYRFLQTYIHRPFRMGMVEILRREMAMKEREGRWE